MKDKKKYLSGLVSYTLKYPLNGRHIEMNVVRQIKTLDCQSVLNVVCVPLKGGGNIIWSKYNAHCMKLELSTINFSCNTWKYIPLHHTTKQLVANFAI